MSGFFFSFPPPAPPPEDLEVCTHQVCEYFCGATEEFVAAAVVKLVLAHHLFQRAA